MAMHEVHAAGGHHAHEDENIDHQGNANLATWLALVAATFTTASFVASNVYLRGWNPGKFNTNFSKQQLLQDLPYLDVLMLLVSGVLLMIAAALFRRNRWKAFNFLLALSTLSYVTVLITQFKLLVWFAGSTQQVATIYAPTAGIQFIFTLICVILLGFAGWYASYGSKSKINYYFPVFMNVWLYTVLSGVVIVFMENVLTVGQFAAWCGQHLT